MRRPSFAPVRLPLFLFALALALPSCANPRIYHFAEPAGRETLLLTQIGEGRTKLKEGKAGIVVTPLAKMPGCEAALIHVKTGETYHVHRGYDLAIHLLSGQGRLTVSGKTRTVHAGDIVFIPRNVPHRFVNLGESPASALAIAAPGLDPADKFDVE